MPAANPNLGRMPDPSPHPNPNLALALALILTLSLSLTVTLTYDPHRDEVLDRLHGEREAGSEGGSAGGWPRFLELDRCSLLPRDSGAFVTLVMESVAAEVLLRVRAQTVSRC